MNETSDLNNDFDEEYQFRHILNIANYFNLGGRTRKGKERATSNYNNSTGAECQALLSGALFRG
jgi:hypothetical protein